MSNMRRREFLAGLGGAGIAWPVVARGQQPAIPVIGFLDYSGPREASQRVTAFRHGLAETGFVEPQNLRIEFRWGENQPARLADLANELVNLQVAAIVTQNATTSAAKAATSTIPIVFVSGGDPIVAGLVKNLNRPGGNVTGVSYTTAPLNGKRLELLRELAPNAKLIAVLHDPRSPQSDIELRDLEEAARKLGQLTLIVKAAGETDFNIAFATIDRSGAGALLVGAGAFFLSKRRELVARAAKLGIPAIYILRSIVDAGGLMSYGADDLDAYSRSGIYVGQILKGAKPGELPVEMPRSYQLVINVATARALGITVPSTLLARADEVIE
jgi:putative ABC transport system substrate-binding protein